MRRIGLAVVVGLGFTLAPFATDAQKTTRPPLVGFLCNTTKFTQAFDEGLRELGYVDGRNILVQYRCVEGRTERGPELAAALLRLKPDLLVGSSDPLIKALVDATHTIPIVMAVSGDPVGNKFVAHRQGFDLQLTEYDERGGRATFYTTGMEHSPTSATGTAWERAPWHATPRAAWATINTE